MIGLLFQPAGYQIPLAFQPIVWGHTLAGVLLLWKVDLPPARGWAEAMGTKEEGTLWWPRSGCLVGDIRLTCPAFHLEGSY